jgi:hypothetical protein
MSVEERLQNAIQKAIIRSDNIDKKIENIIHKPK